MGLPQAPFVTASLVSGGAAGSVDASASCPAHQVGGTRPRWRISQRRPSLAPKGSGGGSSASADPEAGCGGGVACRLLLPLSWAARRRPVQTLRVEVQAMDRAFGHTLLGAAEVDLLCQPSSPTTLRLPLAAPSSAYSLAFVDGAAAGLGFGGGPAAAGFLDVEVEVVAETGTAAGLDSLSAMRRNGGGGEAGGPRESPLPHNGDLQVSPHPGPFFVSTQDPFNQQKI